MHRKDELVEIVARGQSRLLTLNFEESADRKLPVTFTIPRLRWSVRGLAQHQTLGWLSETLEVTREEFEASREITLVVQLPHDSISDCAAELEGSAQNSQAKVRYGQASVSLSQFSDSLLHHHSPLARFVFSFIDPAHGEQKVPTLLVRTQWVVERFECHDLCIVTFCQSEQEPDRQLRQHEQRTVRFKLNDAGVFRNRRLRLWNLLQPWDGPLQISLPDGGSQIEINEPDSALPAGKYRVELFVEGEFETTAPPLPPRKNDLSVFDITLGEAELIRSLLPPPASFRHRLSRRLAGHTANFDLSQQVLTEADLDELALVLTFLIGEQKEKELKRLWYGDLAQQIRQLEVRKTLRTRMEYFAERGDDFARQQMRALCQITGLAVESLIPFRFGTRVSFENKVAVYQGISKWEYQNNPNSKDDPWDLICLEYLNDRRRIIRLSFLSEMSTAHADAPLSKL